MNNNLFSTVIEGGLPWDRKENWVRYYNPLLHHFGASYLVAASDSPIIPSPWKMPIQILRAEHIAEDADKLSRHALNVITFETELPDRGPIPYSQYPRWWRSLSVLFELAIILDSPRFINMQSDAWVYTQRLADRLTSFDGDIGCPWCPRYNMPELMLAAYGKSSYCAMLRLIHSKTWAQWNEPQPENFEWIVRRAFDLEIWNEMVGDRYVESDTRLPDNADFEVQMVDRIPVWKGIL